VNDYNNHVASFGSIDKHGHRAASAEPEPNTIGQPTQAQELGLLGHGCRDWAAEMEEEMALEPQGEYLQAGYLDPTPAPPPPAPWYPPQPPTLDYPPPQTHYLPPHMWYNPPDTQY
jgi:hypothetical protein